MVSKEPESPQTSKQILRLTGVDAERLRALTGWIGYLGRRLISGAIILLAIVYLTHFGLAMARDLGAQAAFELAASRTLESIINVLTGELGLSTAASSTLNPIPVREAFPAMLSRSFGLLGLSLLAATLIGGLLGIAAGRARRAGWSLLILLLSIAGISTPSFFAAFILQRLVIRSTQTLGYRLLPVGGFGWDEHLVLPMLVLAARPIAQVARVTFMSVREIYEQDYVRTAWSKGLGPRWVMWKHVMRNAAIPIVTTVGLSLRFSLSSLPVVEAFFGWSGLGFYLLRGISQQDDNLTVILVLCLGALFIVVNLMLDVLYRLLDPRLRGTVDRVGLEERMALREWLRELGAGLVGLLRENPLTRWLRRRNAPRSESPFKAILARRETQGLETHLQEPRPKPLLRSILVNLPLILGGLMVAGLLVVTLWGHKLAPRNPYTTLGLQIVDGEFLIPPFEPGEEYVWGTDLLGRDVKSLVMAGAWQTMRLAAAVVAVRLTVGFILGALAGWRRDSWLDRAIMGLAETLFAYPPLLLAMVLILAMGIRRGFMPFLVALGLIGWGEIMQYVRGEVLAMRPKTFIESAIAIGRGTSGIITKHVLPNLVPTLLSLAALEMGAVLMILGELGFVGVFIGGGAYAELIIDAPPYHYSDVPEWAALLSNVRLYAQSYPWTAFYPATAFFLAILAFNLFGEGMRRLVTEEGVRLHRVFNRYSLAAVVVFVAGATWLRGSTGSISIYRERAEAFSGANALRTVEALTTPAVEGRALGTLGPQVAAQWIADQFENLGLQPAGQRGTYFLTRQREFESLDAVPCLVVDDGGGPPVYGRDYNAFAAPFRSLGAVLGPVRVMAFGDPTRTRFYGYYPAMQDLSFEDEILMVLSPDDIVYLHEIPHAGALVVAEDPRDLQRNFTLSPRSARARIYGTGREIGRETPVLMISEGLANRILERTGETVQSLRSQASRLVQDEIMQVETGVDVGMQVEGTIYEKEPMQHVIGHWPGEAATGATKMDERLIVVMAKYDAPPLPPDGEVPQGANDNASGVAVLLEAIRVMQESGYQPKRTFLFVAYSGEGMESGLPVPRPEVSRLLQAKAGFARNLVPEAVVELRGLGAGEGAGIELLSGGSLRLADLFEDVTRRLGLPISMRSDDIDLSAVYRQGSSRESAEEAPRILVSWEGWEQDSLTNADVVEKISEEKLERAGKAVALALMIMGREIDY